MLKVENLKLGFGDQVCDIITELINLELYRRDFKFSGPIFPKEEEVEADDDDENYNSPNKNNDDSEEITFMIHGG